jgi:hypothetical protein
MLNFECKNWLLVGLNYRQTVVSGRQWSPVVVRELSVVVQSASVVVQSASVVVTGRQSKSIVLF